MTPKGADLEATDLIEVSTIESGSYVTRSITGQELIDAIPLPPSGLTIGTTPIASGTIGRVLFQGTGNVLQQSGNLFWDSTNNRLGVNTSTPSSALQVVGTVNATNIQTPLIFTTGVDQLILATQGGTSAVTIFPTTRNVVIQSGGTTTDAGFRLDVNGTARVQTSLLLGSSLINANTTAFPLQVNFTNPALNVGAIWRNGSSTGYTSFRFYNNINDGGRALEMGYSGSAYSGAIISGGIAGESAYLTSTGAYPLQLGSNNVTRFIIASSGNLLVNTTTDAGFRLDVNGTARVKGTGTTAGTSSFTVINSASTQLLNVRDDGITQLTTLIPDRILFNGGTMTISVNGTSNTTNFYNSGTIGQKIQTQTGTNLLLSAGTVAGNTVVIESIGGTGASVNNSAILQTNSTTQGFLPPRMTTTQRNAIASPAAGLIVYDTTLNLPHFFNGTIWVSL
jgi:hypothetical protein